MRRLTIAMCVLVLYVVAASPAPAQEYRGELHLTVLTEAGEPVEEAVVTATCGAAKRTASTSATGTVHFTRLQPGDYTVEIERVGFETTVLEGVIVATATAVEMDARLQPAGIVERVVVTADTPLVDRRDMGRKTVISPEEVTRIPTVRDPWALLSTVPGIQPDRVDVGGTSSGFELNFASKGDDGSNTAYVIDGADVSIDVTGFTWWKEIVDSSKTHFDFNSFQEIGITTAGGSLEQSTAGAQLSFVTKQGTNRRSGSLGLLWADRDTSADPQVYQQPDGTPASAAVVDRTFERFVDLGGPIKKDKAWYWLGYSGNDTDRSVPSGSELVGESWERRNYTGKLHGVVGVKGTYKVLYTEDKRRNYEVFAHPVRAPEATLNQEFETPVYSADLGWFFTSNLGLSVQYSHVGEPWGYETKPVGTSDQILYDYSGVIRNTTISDSTSEETDQLAIRGNYFVTHGKVNHEFTFGYKHTETEGKGRLDQGLHNVTAVEWQDACGISDPGPEPNYCGVALIDSPIRQAASLDSDSVWAGDTILWRNWAFNVGALWIVQDGEQKARSIDANGFCPTCIPAIDFSGFDPGFEWNDVLPRAGMTYTFDTPRRQLVRAGWAQYADRLKTAVVSFGNPAAGRSLTYPWIDDNQDRWIQSDEVDFDTVLSADGVDPDDPTSLDVVNWIDTDLEAPRTRELVVGYEREVMRDFSVGISYTRRERDRTLWTPIVDLTTVVPGADTSTYGALASSYWEAQPEVTGTVECFSDIGPCYLDKKGGEYSLMPYALNAEGVARTNATRSSILTNRPGYSQDFDGIELTATKRLSDRWMLRGYLAWQSWRHDVSRGGNQNPAIVTPWLPLRFGHQPGGMGRADGDAVNPAFGDIYAFGTADWAYNVNFLYELPRNFTVSGNLNGHQGYAQTTLRFVGVADADGRRESQNLQIDDTDSRRYDDVHVFDLKLSYLLALPRDMNADFSVECFNAFNEGTIVSMDPMQQIAAGRIGYVVSPRIFRLGARLSF